MPDPPGHRGAARRRPRGRRIVGIGLQLDDRGLRRRRARRGRLPEGAEGGRSREDRPDRSQRGGLIAPIAASRSGDVAFIVLMAGTGLPGVDILKAQGLLIWKAEGLLRCGTEARPRRAAAPHRHLPQREGREGRAGSSWPRPRRKPWPRCPIRRRRHRRVRRSLRRHDRRVQQRLVPVVPDPRPAADVAKGPLSGAGDQRREGPPGPPEGEPGGDRQGTQGRGEPGRQDDRVRGAQPPLPALQDGSPSEYARIETTIAPRCSRPWATGFARRRGRHGPSRGTIALFGMVNRTHAEQGQVEPPLEKTRRAG